MNYQRTKQAQIVKENLKLGDQVVALNKKVSALEHENQKLKNELISNTYNDKSEANKKVTKKKLSKKG